jgi:predicted phage terminase large subunit-like protein
VTRIRIPKASKAQAKQAAQRLEDLIARLREMEDFPVEERTPEAGKRRRERGATDYAFWARTYLPELIQGDGCALHQALAMTCQRLAMGEEPSPIDPGAFGELVERQAEEGEEAPDINAAIVAAPRGHAKSTWGTIGFSAWALLHGHKGYAQAVSDTFDQAKGFVEAVRLVLTDSPRLRTDYGQLTVEGPEGVLDLALPSGPDGGKPPFKWARLQGFGSGQKLRGRTFQGRRPDLVVLDDAENDELVENPARRKKLRGWFIKAVIPALDPTRGSILALGTVLHDDSLLMSLLKTFGGAIWRCWDEDENPLWPERFPAKHLRWLRSKMDAEDPGSFSQEMENRAQGDAEKPFKEPFQEYDQLPERLNILTHVDPAMGKRRSDGTALLTVGFSGRICYVLDAVIGRLGPTATGWAILKQRETYPGRVQAEDVAYQAALAEIVDLLAEQAGRWLNVELVKPQGEKTARIEALAPAIETGKILFPSRFAKGNGVVEPMMNGGWSGMCKLRLQLAQFPKSANDDGPDALQGATGGRFKKAPFGGVALGMRSGVIE